MRHLVYVAVFVITACALATSISNEFYLRIIFSICTYYLCAVGTNVLLGYAGQKSLGQAGLFAAGAYSAALLTTRLGYGPWTGLALAAVISAAFGVVISLPALRVRGPSLAMVTLAFGVVVEKVVSEITEPFGGATGIYAIQPLTLNGKPFTMFQWVMFGVLLSALAHLLLRNLLNGRYGRAFLSLQADELAAGSVGVSVYRYKVLAFVIAAITCGIAGALVAQQNQYINSDFISFNLSVFIILVVLFGGAGTIYGPLVGSIFLVILGALFARWTWIENFVNGALLLFALYAMPNGLMHVISRAASAMRPQFAARQVVQSWAALPKRDDAQKNASGEPLLVATSINKSYGGVTPARNVALTVRSGDIHALIGPNGAGKSTLINILSGVVQPDTGSIAFRGRSLGNMSVDAICGRGVARTFQNLRLFKDLSVLENVLLGQHRRIHSGFWAALGASPHSRSEERRALAKVQAILAFVGLQEYAHSPAGSLAYGLQRRVELARALATEPALLLLDEPAAGLNPSETDELGDLLVRIRDEGISLLLVEHHMDLVMKISDQITVLNYGEKIAEGTPSVIQADPSVIAAYLGTDEEV